MSEVNDLLKQLDDAKSFIARRDKALKLHNDPIYKELILEGFCKDECARYVHASSDPALTAEQRSDALAIAQAAGHFRRFMSVIITMGNQSENMLDRLEAEIEAARAEEAED